MGVLLTDLETEQLLLRLSRFGAYLWTFLVRNIGKRTALPTEALRSTYLLFFPLDVPTLLAMELGVAA
jgi:hypothetical protein